MAANSSIEWTQDTWNPTLGCSKKSPGCKHCYAIRVVHRLAGNPNAKVAAANSGLTVIQNGMANWTGIVRLIPVPPENLWILDLPAACGGLLEGL